MTFKQIINKPLTIKMIAVACYRFFTRKRKANKRTVHNLKLWSEFYNEVANGNKTFEVRKNDRGFKLGDILILKEYCPTSKAYTGKERILQVSYILKGGSFGIEKGFVVLGLKCNGKALHF